MTEFNTEINEEEPRGPSYSKSKMTPLPVAMSGEAYVGEEAMEESAFQNHLLQRSRSQAALASVFNDRI